MNTTLRTIAAALIAASPAFAAPGAEAEAHGILFYLFVGFGALIVVCQLIPGLMLVGGMIRGLFSTSDASREERNAATR